ncbi:hypothetical protein N0V94_009185, partial [Neodidymelliopsis sp. IMI 364377]
ASSGIGLATLRRLLQHGGKVFASDINPLPSPEYDTVPFLRVDVAVWTEQVALFKAAEKEFGAIDHVFANAGIGPTITLLEDDVDDNDDLLPPRMETFNVNMTGCVYTVKLGLYYLKKNPNGGSVVMTASVSSFARLPTTDYTTAKHGVLGLLRSLGPQLHPALPIRINAIAPSWTASGIVTDNLLNAIGEANYQFADVPARSVALLMADETRHGELIYSEVGKFKEIEHGEEGLLAFSKKTLGVTDGMGIAAMDQLKSAGIF